jgi:predicted RNase H-related nuclease YkuK (DUF458 family)
MKWKRAEKGYIEEPILDYLERIIEEEQGKGNKLRVCIGTDAQRRGRVHKFVTIIAIVVESKGGILIYSSEYDNNKMTINQKLIKEVYRSIEVAYEINPLLELYDIKLEIHVDINPDEKHNSSIVIQQAVGYIKGMCNVVPMVKPRAFAASYAADRFKGLLAA